MRHKLARFLALLHILCAITILEVFFIAFGDMDNPGIAREISSINMRFWSRIKIAMRERTLPKIDLTDVTFRQKVTNSLDKLYSVINRTTGMQDKYEILSEIVKLVDDLSNGDTTVSANGGNRIAQSKTNLSLQTTVCLALPAKGNQELQMRAAITISKAAKTYFSGMKILIATDSLYLANLLKDNGNITIYWQDDLDSSPFVWNHLIKLVTTTNTLIWTSPDFIPFNFLPTEADSKLSSSPANTVITFPIQYKQVTRINCYKIILQMYKLSLRSSLTHFFKTSPNCDFSFGPFLVQTSLLRNYKFEMKYDKIIFLDYFINLYLRNIPIVHCQTCGHFMTNAKLQFPQSRAIWIPFVRKMKLNEIETDEMTLFFSCEESALFCTWKHNELGLAMPLCCSREQCKITVELLKFCAQHNIPCELKAGSVLGAIKVANAMPWDIDSDLLYDFRNLSFCKEWIYKEFDNDETKVDFDKLDLGFPIHYKKARYSGILADFYPLSYTQDKLIYGSFQTGQYKPTKALYCTYKSNILFNPGLYARQKYGHEVFQHSLHWRSTVGKPKEFYGGSYKPCQCPKHHACLDVFLPDGNMQFQGVL